MILEADINKYLFLNNFMNNFGEYKSGNVGINTTDPSATLKVNGTFNVTAQYREDTDFGVMPDGGIVMNSLLQQSSGGLVVEYDTTTGEIYAETSTEKVKENIRTLDWDTSKIFDLEVKSYTDTVSGREEFGLIAEEVAEVIPQLVVFDENNKSLGIKSTKLPILLLDQLKKQQEQIEQLKQELEELKSK